MFRRCVAFPHICARQAPGGIDVETNRSDVIMSLELVRPQLAKELADLIRRFHHRHNRFGLQCPLIVNGARQLDRLGEVGLSWPVSQPLPQPQDERSSQ